MLRADDQPKTPSRVETVLIAAATAAATAMATKLAERVVDRLFPPKKDESR